MSDWVDDDVFEDEDLDIEEFWDKYLEGPESCVSDELNIYIEPSTQAGQGGVFIFDNETGEEIGYYDFEEWCCMEMDMARNAKDADDYKEKFQKFVETIIGGR